MAETNIEPGLANFPFMGGVGGLVARLVDHDGPASYTTGGETVTAATLGFKRIAFVSPMASAAGSRLVEAFLAAKGLNNTQVKIIWSVSTTGAEVANATNLSADSCKLLVVGLA